MIPRHTTSCVVLSFIFSNSCDYNYNYNYNKYRCQLSSDIFHPNNQEKKVIQDDIMTPEEKGKTTNSIS